MLRCAHKLGLQPRTVHDPKIWHRGGSDRGTDSQSEKIQQHTASLVLDVMGQPLEMQTDDLLNQAAFQRACVEQLNFLPRTLKKDFWETRINGLLNEMSETEGSIIEVSEDVSITGQFNEHLEDFCTGHQAAEEREQILLKRPWTDSERGETYFRLKDLESHLVKANFKHFKTHQIAQRLRDLNGAASKLTIQGKQVRLWRIPAFERNEAAVEAPKFTSEGEIPF